MWSCKNLKKSASCLTAATRIIFYDRSSTSVTHLVLLGCNVIYDLLSDETKNYENCIHLFFFLTDITIAEVERGVREEIHLKLSTMHLEQALIVSINQCVMFSKCNQFLATDSKLSTAHCTKSRWGHQIRANPPYSTIIQGGGSVRASNRAQTHYLVTQCLAPGGMS